MSDVNRTCIVCIFCNVFCLYYDIILLICLNIGVHVPISYIVWHRLIKISQSFIKLSVSKTSKINLSFTDKYKLYNRDWITEEFTVLRSTCITDLTILLIHVHARIQHYGVMWAWNIWEGSVRLLVPRQEHDSGKLRHFQEFQLSDN